MGSPLISVIVPIYKIDRYLGACIESILNQTYNYLEIILVDDGSPDKCPEICDLYASKDNRIKVIHKQNGGLVSARKAGLLASTGVYIGYVDGDDWIGPGFYQSLFHNIKETNSDIAIAGFSRDLFASTKNLLNAIPSGVYEQDELEDVCKHMLSYGDFYQHGVTTYLWNKLFRKEVLAECQLAVDDRVTIGEDAAVVYKAILRSKRIVITDNCAYHYRQREDSMLKSNNNYVEEYKRLKLLDGCMRESFKNERQGYGLFNQLKDFITGTYIIRSGGRFEKPVLGLKSFPYPIDFDGKKVIVYGAGTFGQQLVRRLRSEQLCAIAGWVDDDYREYRRCCMDIDPIQRVCQDDYDYILIAVLAPSAISRIIQELVDFGVSKKKILSVKASPSMVDKAYHNFISNS